MKSRPRTPIYFFYLFYLFLFPDVLLANSRVPSGYTAGLAGSYPRTSEYAGGIQLVYRRLTTAIADIPHLGI